MHEEHWRSRLVHEGHVYSDVVFVNVQVSLSWKDRFRVLLGRTLRVRVQTFCEVAPGQVVSESRVQVDALLPQRQQSAEACMEVPE